MESNSRGSEHARQWQADIAARVGKAVATRRREKGWSAVQLSNRTTELGFPITRGTIAKIESASRSGKVDVSELMVLAAAMDIPPVQLLFPNLLDAPVAALPNFRTPTSDAIMWFTGEDHMSRRARVNVYLNADSDDEQMDAARPLILMRTRVRYRDDIENYRHVLRDKDTTDLEVWQKLVTSRFEKIAELNQLAERYGYVVAGGEK